MDDIVSTASPMLTTADAPPEGRLELRLTCLNGRVTSVAVHSSRPQVARQLLVGHPPAEAVARVERTFSICGRAQRLAAEAACRAAAGRAGGSDGDDGQMAVLMEIAGEHAWRLLLDWPRQTGDDPDPAGVLALRQAAGPAELADRLSDLLRERILGEPPTTWRARDLAGFDAWRRSGATPTAHLFGRLSATDAPGDARCPLLPDLGTLNRAEQRALGRRALRDREFCARPLWRNGPAETGPVARQAQRPLLAAWIAERGRGSGARLLARLLELVELAGWLKATVPVHRPVALRGLPLGHGSGMACVETARGLLLHALRLADGRIADYRIIAPTEWNFHPAGPLVGALTGTAADSALDARARQVALSLDPCVEYRVDIVDGGG